VGVPRSGTTLLRVLLDSHSSIAGAPETAWITGGYGERSLRELVEFLNDSKIGPVKNLSGLQTSTVIEAGRLFLDKILDTYLSNKDRRFLVLKTPDDIKHLEFLRGLYPDAKFIHIHRDGRDVACSTFAQKGKAFGDELEGFGDLTIANALRRWVKWDRKVRTTFSGASSNYLNISYESLVHKSQRVLSLVTDFIGVPFEQSMIDYARQDHEYPEWEAGSTDVSRKTAIDAGSIGQWRRGIPQQAWPLVDAEFGEYLEALGYPKCGQPGAEKPGQAVTPETRVHPGASDSRDRRVIMPAAHGINLKNQLNEYYGPHRSGWAFAVQSLEPAHDPQSIYLNSFLEKSFVWNSREAVAIKEPWVGFIHIPPNIPDWFMGFQSNDSMFALPQWQESLPYCRGLFTLSDYHRKNLQQKTDLPVNSLLHPFEVPELQWSWERYERNPNKSIVQVGWWLRVLHSIFELPETGHEKIFLRARKEDWFDALLKKERSLRKKQGLFQDSMYETARVVDFVSNIEYDRMLSENIVFVNFYDTSANNAVIECMARNTPILVNPLEAVVEYLGEDYPLYYSNLEEAAEKAKNPHLIHAAHEYLKNLPWKHKLNGDYFRESLLNSEIMQSMQGTAHQPGHMESTESISEINRRGEACFERGELEQAEACFLRVIRADPGYVDGYNNLGVLWWQKGDAAKALEYLATGIGIDANHADLIRNNAAILNALGEAEDAAVLCEDYLARNPGDAAMHELLQELTGRQSSHGEPAGSAEAPPVDPGKLIEDGEQAYIQGDAAKARTLFEQAYELDPKNVDACNNLAVVHWQEQNTDQAIAFLLEALEIDSLNKDVVINGTEILVALGKQLEADELCSAYLERNPGDTEKDLVEDKSSWNRERFIKWVDFTRVENAAHAPRISVVIPSFNQGAYLETTIRSVLDQNYPNLELIIMDGGSTDNSVDIINKYKNRITWWQSQSDDGQYWAVNEGFRRSTGEIMTWINSDDKLHPNSLNSVATVFIEKDRVEWVTGTPNVMNEAGIIKWICHPTPVFSQQNYLNKKYDVPSFIQQEGTFWRRSLWEKSGSTLKTDLQMAGDLELWARFFRFASLYTLNICTGCFREHKDQKTASAMNLYHAEAEQILDAEIDLFRAGGRQLTRQVSPILLKSAAESVNVNRFVRKAVDNELMFTLNELDTCSSIPELGDQDSSSDSMHGQQKKFLVTAIVSTYNSEKYIRGCLEDLQAQTISDQLEIIVVDSGSQQNEAHIVREFQQRFTNIRYIRTEARETIYSAWNRSAHVAKGKYLTNANTDDRHRVDAFEHMVRVLEVDDSAALVYADTAVTTQENMEFSKARITGCFRWPEYSAKHLFSVCYIGPQPMCRLSLHEKYGYFEASHKVAGDYEFWLRMALHEKFVHIPEVLGLYLSSENSIEHAFSGIGVQESEQARVKHWPVEWGIRPALSTGYLVRVENGCITTDDLVKCEASISHSQPLVSVIIATKDREAMLGYALSSLEQQTYKNWEAVVINDGGTDVSRVINRSDSKSRIRYLQNTVSLGQAKARNRALGASSGDIITFLDDDDVYLPGHLATVVDTLNDDERTMFVYTDAFVVQETLKNGVRNEVNRLKAYAHGDYSKEKLHIDNYIPINTWAFRRLCMDKAGHFDESMSCCEDWEFLLRLSQYYEFRHIQSATVEVHHRVDSIDNVTRIRLHETVAAYEYIYSKYTDYDSDDFQQERKNTIAGLHEKLEVQEREKTQYGLRADFSNSGITVLDGSDLELDLERARFFERVNQSDYLRPSVHLMVFVGRNDMVKLSDTLASLDCQIYSGWRLSIISAEKMPGEKYAGLDNVEWVQTESAQMAFGGLLSASTADWLAILNVGDKISPHALSTFVDYINIQPAWKFIYSDESIIDNLGDQLELLLKPDINIDYLCSCPYIGNFCLFRKDVLVEINRTARKWELINIDVCLKVFDRWGDSVIGHIASVLSSRPIGSEIHCTNDELRDVVGEHLRRVNINAEVVDGFVDGTFMVDYKPGNLSKVCVIIDARNNSANIQNTLNSLLTKTDYKDFTVRVAVNNPESIGQENLSDQRVYIDSFDGTTTCVDYATMVARDCDAEYLLFIEPGVLVVQSNWMERMLAQVQRDEIGVAGVRLISPDGRVVHAGIVTGVGSFSVGACAFKGCAIDDPGYMNRALVAQNMSAVSSACMLVDTALFLDVGGFDRKIDVPLYQDVDLCQRVLQENRKIVWTPFVSMLYVGRDLDGYTGPDGLTRVRKDSEYVSGKWLNSLARDVSYNRNLSMKRLDFEVDKTLLPRWDPQIAGLPRVMSFGVGSYGSWQYRVVQPLDELQRSGKSQCINIPFSERNQVLLPTPVELERVRPDTLLMHNTLHDNFIDALEKYKKFNRAYIVFGQDDLMSALPPTNPFSKTIYKDIKKRIRKCLSIVDRLIVTTEVLSHELGSMQDDIVVVPNCIDESVWGELHSQRGVSLKPRVGWAGAQQHMGDLRLLETVVRETASEVDWVFFGMCPQSLLPYVREVHKAVPFEDYPRKLAALNLDLAIAPLEHNRFNECKSNLRILEYGMLGWPVIATDITPYQDAPVCRVINKPEAWIKAIREHIGDLDETCREGDVLRDWVRSNWLLKQHLS